MKKFLKNIFILFTLIVVFNSIYFIYAYHVFYGEYNKNPDKKFHAFIFAESHGLPLGNSLEKHNIFNFSAGRESYLDMKRKIVYLLENNYIVKTIYISVDDHTLSAYRELANNLDRSSIYTTSSDYDNYIDYVKGKYVKYYFPIFQPQITYSFNAFIQSKFDLTDVNENPSTDELEWHELSEKARMTSARNRFNTQFPTPAKSKILTHSLFEIIKICKSKNIKLIGIKFPLSNTYLKCLATKSYHADKIFSAKKIKVMDFKLIFKDKNENFENEDHLNRKGGKKLCHLWRKYY